MHSFYRRLILELCQALLVAAAIFIPVHAALQPLTVYFFDVGQADCILIRTPNFRNILIDAGSNESTERVLSYLTTQKINRLDLVIATHPHEDHIGGMDVVIKRFNIGQVCMPKAATDTRTFESVLLAIKAKGLKITTARAGLSFDLDPALKMGLVAPNRESYENLNDYSAVLRLVYGRTAFLFAGDTGFVSEREMLRAGYDLRADVLKVGHHGSNTSTSAAFLRAVGPRYAVISVGAGNDYGHPGKSTLRRLLKSGAEVLRTDREGTIVVTSDGNTIQWTGSKAGE